MLRRSLLTPGQCAPGLAESRKVDSNSPGLPLVLGAILIGATLVACGSRYLSQPTSDATLLPDAALPDGSPDAGSRCGDGRRDPGESCDGSDLGGFGCADVGFFEGALACHEDCTLDTSGCQLRCGNGRIDPGEACDGPALGGATCSSLGLHPGTLRCREDCTLDLELCPGCGNGVLEPGEACDGSDLAGLACAGPLVCSGACLLDARGCALPTAGTGTDGALDITSDVALTGPAVASYAVEAIDGQQITVADAAPTLQPGDEVLLVHLQGDAADCVAVGAHELGRVAAVQGSDVVLHQPVTGTYGAGGDNADLTGQRVVLQRVPQYASVHVGAGGVLRGPAWDGARGGVLAMRISGTLRIEAGGRISMDGEGYRGGPGWSGTGRSHGRPGESLCGWPAGASDQPNQGGGGGGRYLDTDDDCGQGGGGGGYATPGGAVPFGQTCIDHGATNPASNGGGTYGAPPLGALLPGSGGGAGATDDHSNTSGGGGEGGGILWIAAARVELEGTLSARGANGAVPSDSTDSGNGGGGAGGAILLEAGEIEGAGALDARGGAGGPSNNAWNNPGGDGGHGRIRLGYRAVNGFLYGDPGAAAWVQAHSQPAPGFTHLLLE